VTPTVSNRARHALTVTDAEMLEVLTVASLLHRRLDTMSVSP
jgi:hypothetical protein